MLRGSVAGERRERGRPALGLALQVLEAPDRTGAQRGGLVRDGGFARAFDPRDPAIERRDQLPQLLCEPPPCYRHRPAPLRAPRVRASFQISPQLPQRQ